MTFEDEFTSLLSNVLNETRTHISRSQIKPAYYGKILKTILYFHNIEKLRVTTSKPVSPAVATTAPIQLETVYIVIGLTLRVQPIQPVDVSVSIVLVRRCSVVAREWSVIRSIEMEAIEIISYIVPVSVQMESCQYTIRATTDTLAI